MIPLLTPPPHPLSNKPSLSNKSPLFRGRKLLSSPPSLPPYSSLDGWTVRDGLFICWKFGLVLIFGGKTNIMCLSISTVS